MFNFFKRDKSKDPKTELDGLIGSYELPSFSVALMNILSTLRNPNFSVTQVAEQLQVDPGSHVKVLKMVNSSAFGLSRRVDNLRQAITLLGKSRLETIILSQAVSDSLPAAKTPFFDMRQFWLGSARRAALARALAQRLHPTTQIEAFTAGLLQDMALPILVKTKHIEYSAISEKWTKDPNACFYMIEKDTLGYDHFSIGGLMAEQWLLPESLINAISRKDIKKIDPAINLVALLPFDNINRTRALLIKSCNKHGIEKEAAAALIDQALKDANELSATLR